MNQTGPRPLATGLRPNVKGNLLNTLFALKNNGLEESSLKSISDKLRHIGRYTDLNNPEAVKEFIANKNGKRSYKHSLVKAYDYYVKANDLQWKKPKYHPKKGLPRPPTTEQVKQLIAGASKKYAPIFKFMSETGASPIEVSIMNESSFDFERNTVYIEGRKGHADRIVPIKTELSALMKLYFVKYDTFPRNVIISGKFRKYRDLLSTKLKNKSLRNIRLYDLRHYFGI